MKYKIIGKYIKDLNFKIPSPKTFTQLAKNISNYKINIEIKSNQINEKIIEVETGLSLLPVKNQTEKIITNIVYSTIIELEEKIENKKELEKIILINIPTKIYSELREIFILMFEKSGFKDINISKNVDFEKLHKLKKAQ